MCTKFKITLVLLAAIFIESCAAQDYTTQKINECIELELDKRRGTYKNDESQSISNTFKTFEGFLLKESFLKEINKKNYQELINKVIDNPGNYSKIYKHIHDKEIYYDEYVIMNPSLILNQCRDYVLITERNEYTSTLNLQYKIMQGIVRGNYKDKNIIKELFYNTPEEDFEKIIYRIPFIYIITMNIEISKDPRNN